MTLISGLERLRQEGYKFEEASLGNTQDLGEAGKLHYLMLESGTQFSESTRNQPVVPLQSLQR